jgi:hypothetical protein
MTQELNTSNSQKNGAISPFAFPCIHSYEKQKKIRVVSTTSKFNKRHSKYHRLMLETNIENAHELINRSKQLTFISHRLSAALTDNSQNVPAYFPGQMIPAAGGPNCQEIYRGTLFYEQWLKLFEFDAGFPNIEKFQVMLNKTKNEDNESIFELKEVSSYQSQETRANWPWLFISKPKLSIIHFPSIDEKTDTTKCQSKEKDAFIEMLTEFCMSAVNSHSKLEEILSIIHSLWTDTDTTPITYSNHAIAATEELFNTYSNNISAQNILPFLFELEAFASYMTYSDNLNIIAQGLFADNWLEIGLLPLNVLRATEFCLSERLLDEIINLTQQRFAPIVANEFYSVSDGNHRLTASWLWNLLKYTSNCIWALDNQEFQEKVADFCNEQIIGPITQCEILHHLSVFLANPKYRSILINQVKTILPKYGYINSVPIVFLPEYLSTTVVKDLYDSGKSIRRVPLSIYQTLAEIKEAVLPPRASYHFTDAALLPWFSVLPSAASCNSCFMEQQFA